MKLQDDPETKHEQNIIDAVMDTFDEVDPGRGIYQHDNIYFSTSDADSNEIAVLKFESFPSIPDTEFGRGKSSLQMKEEFEMELMENLPNDIKVERKTRLVFAFHED